MLRLARKRSLLPGHCSQQDFHTEKVFFGGVDTGRTLLCQHHVTANAQEGDSGSPVFRKIGDNQADLYGIVWGHVGTSTFVFSDMFAIASEIPFQSVF